MGAADRPARAWLWSSNALTTGALILAVALAPPASAPPDRALAWLLFTGSSVHVASTGWLATLPSARAYARAHRARCVWVPAGLIAASSVAAALIAPAAFQWLLLPYFGWQFLHYQEQNVGLAALAASASRVPALRRAERCPLLLAGWAGVAGLIAKPRLLGLAIDPGSAVLHQVAAATLAVAIVAGLAVLRRRPASGRPPGFCATYLVSLLFVSPVFLFRSPYAAVGGMTVAHGAQYLLLVGLIAVGGRTDQPRPVRLALLANIALIGGAALNAASHLHAADQVRRLIFGAYLGVVMTHFVIDAGLWRLRDPLARQFVSSGLPSLVPPRNAETAISPADRSSADIAFES